MKRSKNNNNNDHKILLQLALSDQSISSFTELAKKVNISTEYIAQVFSNHEISKNALIRLFNDRKKNIKCTAIYIHPSVLEVSTFVRRLEFLLDERKKIIFPKQVKNYFFDYIFGKIYPHPKNLEAIQLRAKQFLSFEHNYSQYFETPDLSNLGLLTVDDASIKFCLDHPNVALWCSKQFAQKKQLLCSGILVQTANQID